MLEDSDGGSRMFLIQSDLANGPTVTDGGLGLRVRVVVPVAFNAAAFNAAAFNVATFNVAAFILVANVLCGSLASAGETERVERLANRSSTVSEAASSSEQDSEVIDDGLVAALTIQRSVVEAIEKSEKSVVAIARLRKGEIADPTDPRFVPHEFASGVVLDTDGHILTNHHVLGDPEDNDYFVWVQGRHLGTAEVVGAPTVVGADPWSDLAVLQIRVDDETRKLLTPIQLGDGTAVRKGQFVVSLGNPHAIARDGAPSASWGIISNLSRRLVERASVDEENNDGEEGNLHHYGTLIQTDAQLQRGTSGGALINLKGEMIGLTVALAAMDRFESGAGFAIPVDETFKRVVSKLVAGEEVEYGFLGVSPRDLTETQRREGEIGIVVAQVIEGTPAAAAGIQFGDRVTHLDGIPIDNSIDFLRHLGKQPVAQEIKVSILRRRVGTARFKEIELPIVLSKKYFDDSLRSFSATPRELWRGLEIDYATAIPRFAERGHFVDSEGCVAIRNVERESVAWNAGLRNRDFITHVDGKRVTSPQDFHDVVAGIGARPVEIKLTHATRGNSQKFIVPIRPQP